MENQKLILIVDDDRDVLDALYRRLTDEGFKVIPRQRPEFALHDLANNPVDLIMSDFSMGEMNGIEFGLEAALLKPNVPFVLVSGSNQSSLERYADEAELKCTILTKGSVAIEDMIKHLHERMN